MWVLGRSVAGVSTDAVLSSTPAAKTATPSLSISASTTDAVGVVDEPSLDVGLARSPPPREEVDPP